MTSRERPGEAGGEAPPAPSITRRSADRKGRRRKNRGGIGGRKNTREFMDVADEAYTYQMAMSIWRDAEAVLAASSTIDEGLSRLLEAGDFENRGEHAPIWQARWREAAEKIRLAGTAADRLEIVLDAVKKSVEEENEARKQAGQPPVIDEKEGQKFIDNTVDWMLEDSDGEVEGDIDAEDEDDEDV